MAGVRHFTCSARSAWCGRPGGLHSSGTIRMTIGGSPFRNAPNCCRRRNGGRCPGGPLFKKIAPVTAVDFCYGWTLWVYLTWLPSILAASYHLPIKKFVWFSTGVLLAGVIGDTVGGLLSDALLVRTGNLKFARRLNLVVGLLGSLLFLLPILIIRDLITVSILLSLAFFFLELCNPVLWALSMDMAPQYAGTAGGMMNLGFGIAGVLSPSVFGFLIDRTGSWQVPFATSVLLLFVGVLLAFRIDPTRPLKVPARASHSCATPARQERKKEHQTNG